MSLAKEGGSARHCDIQRLARRPWCILSTLIDSSVGGFYLGRDAPLQIYERGEAEEWNGTEEKQFCFEGVFFFLFFFFLCFAFFLLLHFFLFFFSFFPLFFTVRLQASAARRAKKFSF